MTNRFRASAAILVILAAACQPAVEGGAGGSALVSESAAAFAGIAPDEIIRFTGTEPFWGGEIAGTRLRWTTPENAAGETIEVQRFAGNNGLAYTGMLGGQTFDMAITPGACSDGMSDRRYPYTVTVKLGDAQRSGCAWTAAQPFSGAAAP